jgi:hypothetical protein
MSWTDEGQKEYDDHMARLKMYTDQDIIMHALAIMMSKFDHMQNTRLGPKEAAVRDTLLERSL